MDAGKVKLCIEPFDLKKTLNSVLARHAPKAAEKGIGISLGFSPAQPQRFWGDEKLIKVVITNLVENAVKFTETGGVEILVSRAGPDDFAADGLTTVEITVKDTGIGIEADQMNLIFKAFNQENTSNTRKKGGTGLGLSIAKKLQSCWMAALRWSLPPARERFSSLVSGLPVAIHDQPNRSERNDLSGAAVKAWLCIPPSIGLAEWWRGVKAIEAPALWLGMASLRSVSGRSAPRDLSSLPRGCFGYLEITVLLPSRRYSGLFHTWPKKKICDLASGFYPAKIPLIQHSDGLSFCFNPLGIALGMFTNPIAQIRQNLRRQAAKPAKWAKSKRISIEPYPNDTSRGLLCQRGVDALTGVLAVRALDFSCTWRMAPPADSTIS